MKQALLLGLVAFVVAVAGSTWSAVYFGSPPRESSEASSTVPLEPGAQFGVRAAELGARSRDSSAVTTGGASPVRSKPNPPPAPPVAAGRPDSARQRPPLDSAALARSAKSVAKVMASMKPKDAVGILDKLTDEEVERIVRQLNPKQVAALLAVFPQERAAGLSRKLLGPKA